ncbi:MAG TPA: acyl carrier protein [Candidatus Binatia bacterium]|jgi:acyl carrier protein
MEPKFPANKKTQTEEAIRAWLTARLSEVLGIAPETIDDRRHLTSYGIDSLIAFNLTGDLAEKLGRDLPSTLLWDYPTLDALAAGLAAQTDDNGEVAESLRADVGAQLERGDGPSPTKQRKS